MSSTSCRDDLRNNPIPHRLGVWEYQSRTSIHYEIPQYVPKTRSPALTRLKYNERITNNQASRNSVTPDWSAMEYGSGGRLAPFHETERQSRFVSRQNAKQLCRRRRWCSKRGEKKMMAQQLQTNLPQHTPVSRARCSGGGVGRWTARGPSRGAVVHVISHA